MTSNRVRLGVIGLGFGRLLVNHLAQHSGVDVVAVADHAGRRLGVPLQDFCWYHNARLYHDGAELLATESIDGVIICTPPASHRQLVEIAARHKVHILLEKPMAASLEDCDAISDTCRSSGVLLCMEFPMRHLPVVRRARQLLAGQLGRPLLASADYVMGPLPDDHWVWGSANGAGPINENTCHIVDTLRYLLGDVSSVTAFADNLRGPGRPVPDCAAFSLRFRTGALAGVTGGAVGDHNAQLGPRINIYAEQGQILLTGRYHTFHRIQWTDDHGELHGADSGAPPIPPGQVSVYERFPLHQPCVDDFIRAIQMGGNSTHATVADGRAATEIAYAVVRSARSRQPCVVALRDDVPWNGPTRSQSGRPNSDAYR